MAKFLKQQLSLEQKKKLKGGNNDNYIAPQTQIVVEDIIES